MPVPLLGTLHYSLRDLPAAARYFDRASAVYDSMSDTLSRFTEISWRRRRSRKSELRAG